MLGCRADATRASRGSGAVRPQGGRTSPAAITSATPDPESPAITTAYRHLLGRRIEASIGEPWDFESADGANRLVGEVADVIETLRGTTVVCRVGPFEARGTRVTHVVPINRYVGCSLADFAGGDSWTVNLVYRLSDKPIGKDEIETLLRDNSLAGNFLIGWIRLA